MLKKIHTLWLISSLILLKLQSRIRACFLKQMTPKFLEMFQLMMKRISFNLGLNFLMTKTKTAGIQAQQL